MKYLILLLEKESIILPLGNIQRQAPLDEAVDTS